MGIRSSKKVVNIGSEENISHQAFEKLWLHEFKQ